MTVKTHAMWGKHAEDYFDYQCGWCDHKAWFWSQNGGKKGVPLSPSFFHCQKHRTEARASAEVTPYVPTFIVTPTDHPQRLLFKTIAEWVRSH